MKEIILAPNNETTIFVFTDSDIEKELSDYFSYVVPAARFMKNNFRKHWDGKIRLFNRVSKTIPKGILPRIITWAQKQGYKVVNNIPTVETSWTPEDTLNLVKKYPVSFELRDYQLAAITCAMNKQRCVLISPTGSGKTIISYYVTRARLEAGKVLVVVPNVSLVSQMISDWKSYGWKDLDKHLHSITAGVEKTTDKPCVLSTWQSIFRLDQDWFHQFDSLLIEEAHLSQAKSLSGIAAKMTKCVFRIGSTGTLDDTKSHRLVVEGTLGKGYKLATTADLQTKGHLSPIKIQAHYLQYNSTDKHSVEQTHRTYQDEIDFIVGHQKRMDWLVDFIGQLDGNVLVLFQFIEKHGEVLHKQLQEKYGKTRPVHYVVGDVSGEDREDIRSLIETQDGAIIAASYGTLAVGVNIKKLHHIVFASPTKSRYRVLQGIGRGLRLHESKKLIHIHDVVDCLDTKTHTNYALKHWVKRNKFYQEELFPVEEYVWKLEKQLLNG